MSIKEALNKTGVQVKGIVASINEYISDEKKVYHSVDLIVSGMKQFINISLPEGFDRSKILEGETVLLPVKVSVFNNKTRFTAI